MQTFDIRLGAAAGWIAFIGVTLLLVIGPMMLAGQPPSALSSSAEVAAYFGHGSLAPLYGVVGPLIVLTTIVPFGVGLRAALRSGASDGRTAAFADYGLVFLVIAAALYAVSGSMVAGLVDAAGRADGTLTSLFRQYDVLYDGAADVLEGAWIGAFSVAMLGGALPRWIGWLGIVVGLSRWLKAFAPFVPALVPLAIPGGVLFLLWFLVTVIGLTRSARRVPALAVAATATAGAR
jgi:hypothetical protein